MTSILAIDQSISATKALLFGIDSSLIDHVTVKEILCLSITNQRETIVVFGRLTREPLYNAIVWQCRRGDPICQALLEAGHSDSVRQKIGLKIDTYFPASKLTWLFEHEP